MVEYVAADAFGLALSGGNITSFNPHVQNLEITNTTEASLTFNAKINFTNPTEYSATVPYVNIRLLANDSILGNATARDVVIVPGPNYNIPITSIWNPVGEKSAQIGRDLLSQYISGTSIPSFHPLVKSHPHFLYLKPFRPPPTISLS